MGEAKRAFFVDGFFGRGGGGAIDGSGGGEKETSEASEAIEESEESEESVGGNAGGKGEVSEEVEATAAYVRHTAVLWELPRPLWQERLTRILEST